MGEELVYNINLLILISLIITLVKGKLVGIL